MAIKKMDINEKNIKKVKHSRLEIQRIGVCRLKPITDPKVIASITEAMAEMPERIKKHEKNKLKTKSALNAEFNHVRFE